MRSKCTVEIKLLKTELLQGLVELSLDKVRLVRGNPELGGDEELLTGDDRPHHGFIYHDYVEVTITISDGDLDLDSGVRGDRRCQQDAHTAFSTSFGFDSNVPRPIRGIVAPALSGAKRHYWGQDA